MQNATLLDNWVRALLGPRQGEATSTLPARQLALTVALCGGFYGLSMGAYSPVMGGSLWQMIFSGVKVPGFLGCSALICLPAMYLMYALNGLAEQFKATLKALLGGLAALATFLFALAPFTVVAYVSGISYRGALLWNVGVFAAAFLCSQHLVRRQLRGLIQSDGRHLTLLRFGLGLFAFVGMQLAWNLRPFVGAPLAGAAFFRDDAWTNAYLGLWRVLAG